jgi:hypothetical protein
MALITLGANSGKGKVIQVKNTYNTSNAFTTSSTSYSDCGLSVDITPTSSSNKILILGNITGGVRTDNHLILQILRDTTQIEYMLYAFYSQSAGVVGNGIALNFYDSPSTTSQITYKIQFSTRDSGETVDVRDPSSITVMEIEQ